MRSTDLDGDIWTLPREPREKSNAGILKLPPLALGIIQKLPKVASALVLGPVETLPAAAALRQEGIAVSDLALRRPTLDDVFLELTGNPPSEDGALPTPTSAPAETRRLRGDCSASTPRIGRRD